MTIAPDIRVVAEPAGHPLTRLERLFDPATTTMLRRDEGSGVVTATGDVDGLRTVAYVSDPSRMGGAMSAIGCAHVVEAIDLAHTQGWPVVGLWHSGGARLTEGVVALDGVGAVFAAIVRASGRVPQISAVLGPAAGGAAYGPALTDVVVMSDAGRMFVTGPDVVRSVTGEQVDMAGLGGPGVHGPSGVAHVVCGDEDAALATVRQAVDLLGRSGRVIIDDLGPSTDLAAVLPERAAMAYDVKQLIRPLLDGPGLELHRSWAPNVVTALGRLGGQTVGVIANNPIRRGGCLDSPSAEKAARFVRMCDAFGVPLVVIVDVPGYLPGVGQERDGIVRRGAKLLHAFADAVVPRVTLITRKSFGGAYIAMNCRALGATAVFAWPGAEVSVMGAPAAVEILHRRRLAACPEDERHALREVLIAQHTLANGLDRAVETTSIDEVIEPSWTRRRIAEVIAGAPKTRGTHRNMPL